MREPARLTVVEAAAQIRSGDLSSEELVRSCLARIYEREPSVRAWLSLTPEQLVRDARELDKHFTDTGKPKGPLHGIPLGVKDIIDTYDHPTTCNSPIYQNTWVRRDAACVAIARSAGALIAGKTDTVEFAASGRKAATRNPHDYRRTPGGSSSGSAAAVADLHVPFALGTQTGGSHIRPASFCGVYGMKPTWNRVSREGIRMNALSLDTVGWYARSLEDLVLIGSAFGLHATNADVDPGSIRVGVCHGPNWSRIEASGAEALTRTAKKLSDAGVNVEQLVLPDGFDELPGAHRTIMWGEAATSFFPEYVTNCRLLHPGPRSKVENSPSPRQLLAAYDTAAAARPKLDRVFDHDCDVILTPSAPGEAPVGIGNTGDPCFNSMWTLLHVPCIAIPTGYGSAGLPVGVTLVGGRFADGHLLDIAKQLAPIIETTPQAPGYLPGT